MREVVKIRRGTREWAAWRRFTLDHGRLVSFMDERSVWYVPSQWPPEGACSDGYRVASRTSPASIS